MIKQLKPFIAPSTINLQLLKNELLKWLNCFMNIIAHGGSNKAREMQLYIPSQAVCRMVPQQLLAGCPAGNFWKLINCHFTHLDLSKFKCFNWVTKTDLTPTNMHTCMWYVENVLNFEGTLFHDDDHKVHQILLLYSKNRNKYIFCGKQVVLKFNFDWIV